jgi:hypothetical protein
LERAKFKAQSQHSHDLDQKHGRYIALSNVSKFIIHLSKCRNGEKLRKKKKYRAALKMFSS